LNTGLHAVLHLRIVFVIEARFPCSVTFTSSVCRWRQVSMQCYIYV